MTDIRSDLEKCYIPGVQIETFTSSADFIEKAEIYLANPEKERKSRWRDSRGHSLNIHMMKE